MALKLKRAYEPVSRQDGLRVLVDRIWPRGLKKKEARIDQWPKEIAPSTELRRWFGHDPDKWAEFQRRYRRELKAHDEELTALADEARHRTVTLVYAARDEQHNNAVALKEVLEERLAEDG